MYLEVLPIVRAEQEEERRCDNTAQQNMGWGLSPLHARDDKANHDSYLRVLLLLLFHACFHWQRRCIIFKALALLSQIAEFFSGQPVACEISVLINGSLCFTWHIHSLYQQTDTCIAFPSPCPLIAQQSSGISMTRNFRDVVHKKKCSVDVIPHDVISFRSCMSCNLQ